MPRIPLKTSGNTTLDNPHKSTECLKTYKHHKDLNRHIRSVHNLVRYTCTKCYNTYTRQYNLIEHLSKDCIVKVGPAPVIQIQRVLEYLQGYKIPKYPMPLNMPRYMRAETLSAHPGSSTKTCLLATVTPSTAAPGEAWMKVPNSRQ